MSQSQSCGKIYDLVDALQKLYDEGVHVIPGAYAIIRSKDLNKEGLRVIAVCQKNDILLTFLIKRKCPLKRTKKSFHSGNL